MLTIFLISIQSLSREFFKQLQIKKIKRINRKQPSCYEDMVVAIFAPLCPGGAHPCRPGPGRVAEGRQSRLDSHLAVGGTRRLI